MRTVRCSSRLLGGGVCPGVYPSMHWSRHPPTPPVDRILNTRLWKYYLAATSLRTVMMQPHQIFSADIMFGNLLSVAGVGAVKRKILWTTWILSESFQPLTNPRILWYKNNKTLIIPSIYWLQQWINFSFVQQFSHCMIISIYFWVTWKLYMETYCGIYNCVDTIRWILRLHLVSILGDYTLIFGRALLDRM